MLQGIYVTGPPTAREYSRRGMYSSSHHQYQTRLWLGRSKTQNTGSFQPKSTNPTLYLLADSKLRDPCLFPPPKIVNLYNARELQQAAINPKPSTPYSLARCPQSSPQSQQRGLGSGPELAINVNVVCT